MKALFVEGGPEGMTGTPGERRLCIPSLRGFMIVQLENIIYCEAERSYTVFHCKNKKTIMASRPLADYDQLLADADFMRVHKSYLINLGHIKEYQRGEGGMVIMSNGIEIEVSRRRKDLFLERIKTLCRY
jgi:two-component system LytT family response regulator